MHKTEPQLEQELYTLREAHKTLLMEKVNAHTTKAEQDIEIRLQENERQTAQIQKQLNNQYTNHTKQAMPRAPIMKNVWHAFLVGGLICTAGQIVILLMQGLYDMDFRSASAMASVTVVVVTAILTGLGIYDEIGRFGGAGSLSLIHI